MATEPEQPQNIAVTVTEVTERATLLIREEIELAKAEISEKITRLVKGAVVGVAGGIFVVTALLFVLHGFAWLATFELFNNQKAYWGFFIVAGALILLGVLAGFVAFKAVKFGAPPTPTMAIDEARKIRETVSSAPAVPDALASDPKP